MARVESRELNYTSRVKAVASAVEMRTKRQEETEEGTGPMREGRCEGCILELSVNCLVGIDNALAYSTSNILLHAVSYTHLTLPTILLV